MNLLAPKEAPPGAVFAHQLNMKFGTFKALPTQLVAQAISLIVLGGGIVLTVPFVYAQEKQGFDSKAKYEAALRQVDKLIKNEAQVISDSRAEHRTQIYTHDGPAEHSVLVLHGLHASPHFMNGISRTLFARGANVISVRLPGHFEDEQKRITKVDFLEWVDAANKGFRIAKLLGTKVTVLGYSTGGTLAANLALLHPRAIHSTVLIAPALAVSNQVVLSSLFLGWTGITSNTFCGEDFLENTRSCRFLKWMDDQIQDTTSHKMTSAPGAGFEVQQLIDWVLSKELEKQRGHFWMQDGTNEIPDYYENVRTVFGGIRTPLLMINSDADNVVQPRLNREVYDRLKGRKSELYFSENDGIRHTVLASPRDQAFPWDKANGFNKKFDPMMDEILEFIWQ